MKKFAVGLVLLAALGAACAKAGSDGPVPDANENAMKAASAAAADSYVSSLEQLAVGAGGCVRRIAWPVCVRRITARLRGGSSASHRLGA
jgi:hypothetical protein